MLGWYRGCLPRVDHLSSESGYCVREITHVDPDMCAG